MQPVGRLFANLPRLIRELSIETQKKLRLVTTGADTELDRQLIDLIRDPLTHLLRNCADHGIESSSVRVAAGKPEEGTISVSAAHEAGYITIEVSDDGRGLDSFISTAGIELVPVDEEQGQIARSAADWLAR